jgi:hypothetical protein
MRLHQSCEHCLSHVSKNDHSDHTKTGPAQVMWLTAKKQLYFMQNMSEQQHVCLKHNAISTTLKLHIFCHTPCNLYYRCIVFCCAFKYSEHRKAKMTYSLKGRKYTLPLVRVQIPFFQTK